MLVTDVRVPTEHASRYPQQISKHWAHKFDVTYSETKSTIPFSEGRIGCEALQGFQPTAEVVGRGEVGEVVFEPVVAVIASALDRPIGPGRVRPRQARLDAVPLQAAMQRTGGSDVEGSAGGRKGSRPRAARFACRRRR